MGGQSGDGSGDRVALEGASAEWIREQANAEDLPPEEYLERLVVALQDIDGSEPREELATKRDVEALESRLGDLDEAVDEKIEDVRDRIVQVKRETDDKAPLDHTHEKLRKDVAAVETTVETVEKAVGTIGETVEGLEARLDQGFENYEEILQYLVDTTDDLSDETSSLASALIALKRSHKTVRAREQRRRRTEELKDSANRAGVTDAMCDSCGNEVSIGLLTEPACPFCGSSVSGVTAKQGFFGSATLKTGSSPALEGGEEDGAEGLDDIVEGEKPDQEATDPMTVLDEDGSLVDVEDSAAPRTEAPGDEPNE
jgi:archaellum component FlaC